MATPTTRATLRRRLRAHPLLTGGGVAAVAVLAVVLLWFQPQALLFDTVVDEEFPSLAGAAGAPEREAPVAATPDEAVPEEAAPEEAAPEEAAPEEATADNVEDDVAAEPNPQAALGASPQEPVALASGSFASRNRYTVTGSATVFALEDGSRTLRLEDFESTNGPDLFVYLAAADSADSDAALDEDAVNLGVLTGNVGNQNYVIGDDVDLDRYDTVVIWCRRFTSGFGAADLQSG